MLFILQVSILSEQTTIFFFFFFLWLIIYFDNFRVILKIDDAALSRPRPNQCTRRNAQQGITFRFLMYKTGTERMARQGMEGKICRVRKARGV